MPGSAAGCPFPAPGTVEGRIREWSIYQPWLQDDPVTSWNELRDHAPVVRSEALGGYWILTRFEDVEWAARTPDVFSSAEVAVPHRQLFPEKVIPVQLDGEEHRRWRGALSDLLGLEVVNHFTPQLRRAVIDTIEPLAAGDGCEFISQVAVRLPAEAFVIVFGIGREHVQQLLDHKEWLRREGIPGAHDDDGFRAAGLPLRHFFADAIDRRRAEGTAGRRDVLSRLLDLTLDGTPDGRAPTRDEMINIAFAAMLAALDTTAGVLGLGYRYLARHPRTRRAVVTSPERIPALTEELLRHEPVVTSARVVTRDVERHGVTMRAGDRVLLSWGMTGLDPGVFDRPDEVDPDRTVTRHLAFAAGPHRCLGRFLARRLIHLCLQEWHARIPDYHLTPGTAVRCRYGPARGLGALHLTFAAAPAGDDAPAG